jgi:uncharacterized protein YukE
VDEEAYLRELSRDLRAASARLEARRAALGRYALVWWQGEAAERYQQRVAQRVTALHDLSLAMAETAVLAEGLATLVRTLGDHR